MADTFRKKTAPNGGAASERGRRKTSHLMKRLAHRAHRVWVRVRLKKGVCDLDLQLD